MSKSDAMYTGPTPMPVRGGPRTTSLIDDLTWSTSAHRVPATVKRWPRGNTKGPPRTPGKGLGGSEEKPVSSTTTAEIRLTPTVSTHAFFHHFPPESGVTQKPTWRPSLQDYQSWNISNGRKMMKTGHHSWPNWEQQFWWPNDKSIPGQQERRNWWHLDSKTTW